MTRGPGSGGGPDDPDDRDERSGPGDADEPRGLIRSLLALLQEMEERGEGTRLGHSETPHTSVDFSVSVGGLGGPGHPKRFGVSDRPNRGRDARSDEGTADVDDATEEPHVTTRETADGLVVAADLPGVDESEVETRLEPDDEVLVIEISGSDAARLPLESEGWSVVDSRFSNGVLEVELHRD